MHIYLNFYIFSLIYLFEQISAECGVGCMKCNTKNECLYCDLSINYILVKETCVQSFNANCLYQNQNGTCVTCQFGYYPSYENRCVAVDLFIPNCAIMSSRTICKYCNPGYYPKNNFCAEALYPVEDCLYLKSDGFCEVCVPGSYLFFDSSLCLILATNATCLGYSQIACQTCNATYQMERNNYLNMIKYGKWDMVTFLLNAYHNQVLNILIPMCLPIAVQNCVKIINQTICLTCQSGFNLINNTCQPQNLTNIENCIAFSIDYQCIRCNNDSYLSNGNCITFPLVENCLLYKLIPDKKTSSPTFLFALGSCVQCSTGFYANFNTCFGRLTSMAILNCLNINPIADNCEKCAIGFNLTTDKLACLLSINNCIEYQFSTINDNNFICKTCQTGLFFNYLTSSCVTSSTYGCEKSDQGVDSCIECREGYYSKNKNICTVHSFYNILSCNKWSKKIPQLCNECPENHVSLIVSNFCLFSSTFIKNCQIYASSSTCSSCYFPYTLDSTKTECIISSIMGCMNIDSNGECITCFSYNNTNFNQSLPMILSSSKTCVFQDIEQFINCRSLQVNGAQISCESCVNNYYPFILPFFRGTCLPLDSYKLQNPAISSILANCEFLDLVKNVCIRCNIGYFISNGACVTACSAGNGVYGQMIVQDFSNQQTYIYNKNYCAVIVVPNCAQMETSVFPLGHTVFGTIFQGCVACQSGFLPVIQVPLTNLENSGMAHLCTGANTTKSALNRCIFINSCVLQATVTSNLLPTANINNCMLFVAVGTLYGCFSCNFGFTGLPVIVSIPTTGSYIPVCSIMSTCNSNLFYPGFGGIPNQLQANKLSVYSLPLSIYISCHVCVNTTQVVAFEVSFGTLRTIGTSPLLGQLSTWDFGTPSSPVYSSSLSTQTTCVTLLPSYNLPSNCGVVMVNSDKNSSGYVSNGLGIDSNTTVFCVACKIGFSGPVDSNGNLLACNVINNCQVFIFNVCKVCQMNYIFNYNTTTNRIDNTLCLYPYTPNCYSGFLSTTNSFVCKICNAGFYANSDGYCDQLSISKCSSYSTTNVVQFPDFGAWSLASFDWLITLDPLTCSSCKNAQMVLDTSIGPSCLLNNFLLDFNISSNARFPKNCLSIALNTSNSMICVICKNNYILFNGSCFSQNFTKNATVCTVFDNAKLICLACPPNYFIIMGYCFQGILDKCLIYQSFTLCAQCFPGFSVVVVSGNKTICVNVSSQTNCLSWDEQLLSIGILKCNTCPSQNFVSTLSSKIPKNICFPVSLIPNCVLHNVTLSSIYSTFECLQCSKSFFLNKTYCLLQTYIENCLSYHPTIKGCLNCQPGYQISSDFQNCLSNAITFAPILNCQVYFDFGFCLKCFPGSFLRDNICVKIRPSEIIANCLIYLDEKTCKRCIPGYYSFGINCTLSPALNCLDYASFNSCSSCLTGFGLDGKTPNQNCIFMALINCTIHDLIQPFPFKCLKCSGNSYLDPVTHKCLSVRRDINFCLSYDYQNYCLSCFTGLALSPDQQYCYGSEDVTKNFDPFCQTASLLRQPVCNICGPGFYFKNDICVPCIFNMLYTGCLFCDPDQNEICLLCAKGYYMNSAGLCISNPGLPMNIVEIKA